MEAVHGLLGYFNPALPFSAEELRHNYDFWIDADVQTSPLILEWMLTDFFGEYTDEVKNRILSPCLREDINYPHLSAPRRKSWIISLLSKRRIRTHGYAMP